MARNFSLAPELYARANLDVDLTLMRTLRDHDGSPLRTDSFLPKFTLVVGPSPFTMPRGWEFFLTAPYEGVTYIATVLHNAGFPVRIVDVRYSRDPLREASEACRRDTDVIGLATFEDNFPFCREFMDEVKRTRPDAPIICGGSLVTSVPHIFMEATACDVAVISEGELTILELMTSYAAGRWVEDLPAIRGIAYRAEGTWRRTAPRGQMQDLDSLPRMRLDLWPQARSPQGLQKQIITSCSRGCNTDCSFCYRTTPQVSVKSEEKFAADMDWLKSRYDIDFALFTDLTFSYKRDKTLEVCNVIKDHDIRWTCMTRCANVDPERLAAMRDSGCDIILYGVESLGRDALKEARKPATTKRSIQAMHETFEAGVRFGGLFIIGLPGETEESLQAMCDFTEEFNCVTRVKYLSAMPGTTVYQEAVREGIVRSEVDHLNWLSIEQALVEDEFLNQSGLPEATMREAYQRVYDAYQPGPVMDFGHFPESLQYFHPNADDASSRSTDYAGPGWRAAFSSAGPLLYPGSERYTLRNVGTAEAAAAGAALTRCGTDEKR